MQDKRESNTKVSPHQSLHISRDPRIGSILDIDNRVHSTSFVSQFVIVDKKSVNAYLRRGTAVELLQSGAELKKRFPYFWFEDSHAGVMEEGGAGYVNPRAMVKAQLKIAAKNGTLVVTETAVKVQPRENGVSIVTDSGRALIATKVLLCTDAYTSTLLPSSDSVALTTNLVSVELAEVALERKL